VILNGKEQQILLIKCANTKKHTKSKRIRSYQLEIMSMRCKVCNTSSSISANQTSCNGEWECKTCGNLLNSQGYISSS
jgi:hypothetical protein